MDHGITPSLDDHRVVQALIVPAADHAVQPFGTQGQLVFQQYAVIGQAAVLDDILHPDQRIVPGADFRFGWIVAEIIKKRAAQFFSDLVVNCIFDEVFGCPGVQPHFSSVYFFADPLALSTG